MLSDLDKLLHEARYNYRKAYREWYRIRNSVAVEDRIKAQEELTAAERAFLEIGRRGDVGE